MGVSSHRGPEIPLTPPEDEILAQTGSDPNFTMRVSNSDFECDQPPPKTPLLSGPIANRSMRKRGKEMIIMSFSIIMVMVVCVGGSEVKEITLTVHSGNYAALYFEQFQHYHVPELNLNCLTCPVNTYLFDICREENKPSLCVACPPGYHQPYNSINTSCEVMIPTPRPLKCGKCEKPFTKFGCSTHITDAVICCRMLRKKTGNKLCTVFLPMNKPSTDRPSKVLEVIIREQDSVNKPSTDRPSKVLEVIIREQDSVTPAEPEVENRSGEENGRNNAAGVLCMTGLMFCTLMVHCIVVYY